MGVASFLFGYVECEGVRFSWSRILVGIEFFGVCRFRVLRGDGGRFCGDGGHEVWRVCLRVLE